MRNFPVLCPLFLSAMACAQPVTKVETPGNVLPRMQTEVPTPNVPGAPKPPQLQPIHEAARTGNIEGIKKELAAGVSPNLPVEGGQGWMSGSTPLIWAANLSNAATVKFLLENGADPRQTASDGATALMLCFGGEDITEKVRLLLSAGSDVHATNWDGDTPLIWAAIYAEDPSIIEAMVAAGAEVNYRKPRDRTTPLMVAARRGNEVAVRALVKAGAELEAKSLGGVTALMWAAEGIQAGAETVRVLVELGSKLEATSDDGSTALMIAALQGEPNRVRALLDLGANHLATTPRGDNALMAAARSGDAHTILTLIASGIDPNAANKDGVAPITLAASSRKPEAVRALLRHGANPNHRTMEGWTPLMLVKEVASLEPLVEAGANLEARAIDKDYRGWTPLMFALYDGDYWSVRRLLNAGASVVAKDAVGRTPVDIAGIRVTAKKDEIIALLKGMTSGEAPTGPSPN